MNSPHKGPVTRKMFPFTGVIMASCHTTWLGKTSFRVLTISATQGYYLIQVSLNRFMTNRVILSWVLSMIWGVYCQKQISRAMLNNYIPRNAWDVITCPCSWYLFLARSSYVVYWYRRMHWKEAIDIQWFIPRLLSIYKVAFVGIYKIQNH